MKVNVVHRKPIGRLVKDVENQKALDKKKAKKLKQLELKESFSDKSKVKDLLLNSAIAALVFYLMSTNYAQGIIKRTLGERYQMGSVALFFVIVVVIKMYIVDSPGE